MSLAGSYSLVKTEGILEHMLADGIPEEFAKKTLEHGQKLDITINGDKVTLKRSGDPRPEQTLTLNQETEEKVRDGRIIKNKAVLNGNTLTLESKRDNGSTTRIYSLSGSELTVTLTSSKPGVPVGKRFYKKD